MPSPLAISTCWNSGRHQDGRAMLEELAGLGFDTVELGHGVRFSLWPGVREAVDAGVVKISSLHNFCPLPIGFTRANPNCYEFTDPRPSRRRLALRHTLETINAAASVGASRVVLHLGSTGQREVTPQLESALARGRWGSRKFVADKIAALTAHERAAADRWPWVRDALQEIAVRAREKNIRLGLECRESVEEFPMDHAWEGIFAELGTDFGYWHDFGHAARKDALGWIDHLGHFRRMAPRLIGCHIHDFIPPVQDHQALGSGTIPFASFWPILETDPVFVLELSPRVKVEEVRLCQQWWIKNGPE
ncbi:MAG: sugar phosphate isomerase/epimerase [Candidatus Methylacidiphilales bacterium]|nr:sugar phosphate isomerase/epimerase [Candidatus Methylacidiphilales bacterium]